MPGTGAVAAVDCGTNSTRLLVAGPSGDAKVREMRITRLGQGVDQARVLAPEALERTFAVLREFRGLIDAHSVERARLIATSAVRDARNGDAFLVPAAEIVGVPAELLSGSEEGRLSYAGATADLSLEAGAVVVVDIGGGSTEIATAAGGGVATESLEIGCVRLTERFLAGDPPSTGEVADAVKAVAVELDRAVESIPALAHLAPGTRLVGLAGTVSTLASMELGLARYDRSRIHHAVLPLEAVARWCDVLGAEPVSARGRRPGLPAGRQDVILGGALILREVMGRFGLSECLVSEADILDGLILSQAS